MNTAAVASLTISVAALAVSVYGVFERRSAARRAERVRLTEIIDDLNALGAAADHPSPQAVQQTRLRKEVLVQQAISLLTPAVRPEVTAVELRLLAVAADDCGFHRAAESLFRDAEGATAGSDQEVQLLFARRSHALFLFRVGRPEEARRMFRDVIAHAPETSDLDRLTTLQTFGWWAGREPPNDPDHAERRRALAAEAQAWADRVTDPALHRRAAEIVAEIRP